MNAILLPYINLLLVCSKSSCSFCVYKAKLISITTSLYCSAFPSANKSSIFLWSTSWKKLTIFELKCLISSIVKWPWLTYWRSLWCHFSCSSLMYKIDSRSNCDSTLLVYWMPFASISLYWYPCCSSPYISLIYKRSSKVSLLFSVLCLWSSQCAVFVVV